MSPAADPGPTPPGAVVWFTKGKAMPPIITTPGGGSCATVGRKPACDAPEKAANSATAADVLTTPTPPTAAPFLNSGTPPGFTAAGSLSSASALPVITPKPGLSPSIERAGSMLCPARKAGIQRATPIGVLDPVQVRVGRIRNSRRKVNAADKANRPAGERRLIVAEERGGASQSYGQFIAIDGGSEIAG